jgi:hypothetical protein
VPLSAPAAHLLPDPDRDALAGFAGAFGPWQTIYNRHRRWCADGTWEQILSALQAGCDEAEGAAWTVAVDSTIVRAHQHAAGARHAAPKDVYAQRLAPSALNEPARTREPASTGGGFE